MRNLSDEIIYGSIEGVQTLLAQGADINLTDQYGSTPLIAAARTKKSAIVQLLLAKGARADDTDMSGCCALYWAVEKQDVASTRMLLTAGANPNRAVAGNQPILVYPILRRNKEIGDLLISHGAVLSFATDFIHAKLIGHRFELEGVLYILNTEKTFVAMSLEGFFLEFTLDIILRSLGDFIQHRDAKDLANDFPAVERVITALKYGSELRAYRETKDSYQQYEQRIDVILDADPLIIPVSYEGHAITFVKYKNYLAHCDRGANSKIKGSVVIYKINKLENFNKEFLKKILYERQTGHFINMALFAYLGLEQVESIPTESQITGNCSWANVEASVAALLAMQRLEGVLEPHARIAAREEALRLHAAWIAWDKDRALNLVIQSFEDADRPRKASIASLLGKVLFHRCHYSSTTGVAHARKILKILTLEDFKFVLTSYVQSYCHPDHVTSQGEKFKKLLKKCDVRVDAYLGR